MTVFNEVRISKLNKNGSTYNGASYVWDKSKVYTDIHRLMIRFDSNGHVYLAERPEDEYSDEPWFEWKGWVIGQPIVDEYGIVFEAVVDRDKGGLRRIVITRKGVYSS